MSIHVKPYNEVCNNFIYRVQYEINYLFYIYLHNKLYDSDEPNSDRLKLLQDREMEIQKDLLTTVIRVIAPHLKYFNDLLINPPHVRILENSSYIYIIYLYYICIQLFTETRYRDISRKTFTTAW